MDQLLHRGKYAVEDEKQVVAKEYKGIFQRLGLTTEFTRSDKVIFFLSLGWMLIWSLVFLIGVAYNLIYDVKDSSWLTFWKIYVVINASAGVLITIWLTVGGMVDIRALFRRLRAIGIDEKDDGSVSLTQNKKI
jgi:SSS family solute:Na+ symporter